jgi:response regulator RpfG family c-di-GMP phosphodiesterase
MLNAQSREKTPAECLPCILAERDVHTANHAQNLTRIPSIFLIFLQLLKKILYHHERWDDKGYPLGLKEKKIL